MVEVRIGAVQETLDHEEWERRVRDGRVPADALVRIAGITGDRFVEAVSLSSYRALCEEAARLAAQRIARPPLLTALIVGFQIRLFVWARLPEVRAFLTQHFMNFSPAVFEDGQIWRPFTMGLLQVELLHLAMNMVWLFYVGWNLERTLGRTQLAVIYVVSVLTGSLFSTFASPWVPSLGASGGVFGLVAAVVTFGITRSELVGARLSPAFGMAMLPYLLMTFASGLANEGVDNWCHLGGMSSGLVLGVLLDPPTRERRPGWNRRVWVALALGGGLAVASLGLFGPRMVPLWDAADAQAALRAKRGGQAVEAAAPAYRALRYSVPGGWRAGRDSAGRAAFESPVGDRVFGVRSELADRPRPAEAVVADWQDGVRADWPAATFGPVEPVTLAGRPGVRLRGRTGDARVLEFAATVRGVWVLTVVWEVEPGAEQHLRPLRDRLMASVEWTDPEELVTAREADAVHPTRATRATLAAAEAAVGNREEVLRLHALLLEDPDADTWRACLADRMTLGADADEISGFVSRALADRPDDGKLLSTAADALDAVGAPGLARGLLLVAWERAPGERSLKRARRARGLSVALLPDGRPWDSVHEPVARTERSAAERAERSAAGVNLADAAAADERWQRERAALVASARAHLEAHDPGFGDDLVVLAQGDPLADAAERRLLIDEALGSPTPAWLPPELVQLLPPHAGWVRALAPPEAEP